MKIVNPETGRLFYFETDYAGFAVKKRGEDAFFVFRPAETGFSMKEEKNPKENIARIKRGKLPFIEIDDGFKVYRDGDKIRFRYCMVQFHGENITFSEQMSTEEDAVFVDDYPFRGRMEKKKDILEFEALLKKFKERVPEVPWDDVCCPKRDFWYDEESDEWQQAGEWPLFNTWRVLEHYRYYRESPVYREMADAGFNFALLCVVSLTNREESLERIYEMYRALKRWKLSEMSKSALTYYYNNPDHIECILRLGLWYRFGKEEFEIFLKAYFNLSMESFQSFQELVYYFPEYRTPNGDWDGKKIMATVKRLRRRQNQRPEHVYTILEELEDMTKLTSLEETKSKIEGFRNENDIDEELCRLRDIETRKKAEKLSERLRNTRYVEKCGITDMQLVDGVAYRLKPLYDIVEYEAYQQKEILKMVDRLGGSPVLFRILRGEEPVGFLLMDAKTGRALPGMIWMHLSRAEEDKVLVHLVENVAKKLRNGFFERDLG